MLPTARNFDMLFTFLTWFASTRVATEVSTAVVVVVEVVVEVFVAVVAVVAVGVAIVAVAPGNMSALPSPSLTSLPVYLSYFLVQQLIFHVHIHARSQTYFEVSYLSTPFKI